MAKDWIERLRSVSTATITMQLLKRGLRSVAMRGVKPLVPGSGRLVGEAYTLRFIPGREDLSSPEMLRRTDIAQRRAIEECPAGAVLVIDGCGRGAVATFGDILAARLKHRGVAGVVSDGGVRDAAGVIDVGLPVFCAGPAAPASITALADGDLQVPIGCGGVAVLPGDAIVGDDDGVVVIPRSMLDEIVEGAVEQERHERFILMQVQRGAPVLGTYPPSEENLAAYRRWVEAGEPDL
jgi:regulator of RNase E activity RraA